jgi:hypothetical protein
MRCKGGQVRLGWPRVVICLWARDFLSPGGHDVLCTMC